MIDHSPIQELTDTHRVEAGSESWPRQPRLIASRPDQAKLGFWIASLASLVIVAWFFFWVVRLSYNFPYFDDFEIVLDFLNRFLTASSGWERAHILFEQHGEHRVVFDRVVALTDYYLTGKIDFKWLILAGNAALPVILMLFYRLICSGSNPPKPLSVIPVAVILFNFRYAEATFWATTALQNIWVLAFAFLALYFLFQPSPYSVAIASLFGWLATFTSGNGMATFVAGAIVLAAVGQFRTARMVVWSLSGLTAVGFYFHDYVKPANHPSVLGPLMSDPVAFAGYFTAFLGSAFTENVGLAIAIGCMALALIGYLTAKQSFRDNPIIYSFAAFLLITAFLSALGRFGFGIEQALVSRYTVVSSVLVASCYVAFLQLGHFRTQLQWFLILAGALCFHVVSCWRYLPPKAREKAEFDARYHEVTGGKLSRFNYGWPPLDPRRQFPRNALRTAKSLGYFDFQFRDESEILNSLALLANGGAYQFNRFNLIGPGVAVISGWGIINGVNSNDVIAVIRFQNGQTDNYIVLEQVFRPDVSEKLADAADHRGCGFQSVLNSAEVPAGQYRVTLFLAAPDAKLEIAVGRLTTSPSAWQLEPVGR